MSAARLGFLLGVFGVPVLLLYLGHHFRRRRPLTRAAFWGGSFGYLAGLLATTACALLPPLHWEGGPAIRTAVVHWGMLLGALAGLAIGVVAATQRRN